MPSKPSISVIVSTKQEEKNIGRCLESIKKQNYKGKTEIIVVDNYSKDKTIKIAKQYTKLVFLQGPERSAQRNFGAKKAKGEWLLFLDADMEASANLISECINKLQNALYPPMVVIPENAIGETFLAKALALEKNCYKGPNWLLAARFFQRRNFLKLGGFDPKLHAGEDWDITERFQEKSIPLLMLKKTFIIHYESNLSLLQLLKKESYYIKNIKLYAKKQPTAFSFQGSFLYRGFVWLRSWEALIKHPMLTIAFLGYKFIVWLMWLYYRKGFVKSPT